MRGPEQLEGEGGRFLWEVSFANGGGREEAVSWEVVAAAVEEEEGLGCGGVLFGGR